STDKSATKTIPNPPGIPADAPKVQQSLRPDDSRDGKGNFSSLSPLETLQPVGYSTGPGLSKEGADNPRLKLPPTPTASLKEPGGKPTLHGEELPSISDTNVKAPAPVATGNGSPTPASKSELESTGSPSPVPGK